MTLTTVNDRGLTTPIDLLDNEKIRFGTGDDLEIFHDGTGCNIRSTSAKLEIRSPELLLQNSAAEKYIRCVSDGAVELYYDNTKRFETVSDGIRWTGHCYANDNYKLRLGTGEDLQIYFDGSNSYIKEPNSVAGQLIIDGYNGTDIRQGSTGDLMGRFVGVGAVSLYYDNSKKLETTDDGATIEESTGDAILRVHAAENDSGADSQVILETSNDFASSSLIFKDSTAEAGSITYNHGDNYIKFATGGTTERLRIASNGKVSVFTHGINLENATATSSRTFSITNAGGTTGWTFGNGVTASAHQFVIYDNTAGAQRFKIDSDGVSHFAGDVKVLTGDVMMGSGRGISFSASSNAGGMTSELLDDYEEGTFTPTLGHSNTPTEADGKYTKVGNICVAAMSITFSGSPSNGSSHAVFGSLPFTAASGRPGSCILRYSNHSEAYKIAWHISASSAGGSPYYSNGGAATSYTNLAGGRFDLVAVYRTA
jgi:hypothetical protein